MAKIVYISYDGMTDPLGQSQVLPYLSGLVKKGHEFYLISAEKPVNLKKNGKKIKKICESAHIKWFPVTYTKRPPVISTYIDVLKMKKIAFRICNEFEIDIVHARGHYITSIIAQELKAKLGVKYVFDMRGFWADERIDGNLWSLKNPLYKAIFNYFKKKEREFLEKADSIITLTNSAIIEIKKMNYNINYEKITVIPCCADLKSFDYQKYSLTEVAKLKQKLDLENKYVLVYLGSIGTWYMLPEMLDFFKRLQQTKKNAYFLFITKENPLYITTEAEKKQISKDKLRIVQAERNEVPMFLSVADAGVFFIAPLFSKKGSSPVKHGEMMGMGLPIVCNQNIGDVSEISSQVGINVLSFTDKGIKDGVEELLKFDVTKSKIREKAFEYYDLEEGVEKYNSVYLNCLKNENT